MTFSVRYDRMPTNARSIEATDSKDAAKAFYARFRRSSPITILVTSADGWTESFDITPASAEFLEPANNAYLIRQSAQISSAFSNSRKTLSGLLAAVGALLVIFGVVRLNSMESQLMRAFGGQDNLAIILLAVGIPLFLLALFFFLSGRQAQ
jgi:hypothetical protein